MKKVMDLKCVNRSASNRVMQVNSYFGFKQWVDKYLTQEDCFNGIYVFRTTAEEGECKPNFVPICFAGNTDNSFFIQGLALDNTAKISDFKNGYFVIAFEDGSKSIIVISPTSKTNPIIFLDYDEEIRARLDKVYENPLSIKEYINDIDNLEDMELYHAITQWSFYQKQQETEQIFENLQDILSQSNGTTV